MSELTTQALQYALDGLTLRQQAIAGNISNAQTPGYKAQEVDFEDLLGQAVSNGTAPAAPTITQSTAAGDATGNNVELGAQLVDAQETTLRYQSMVDALNTQFRILRGSMGGGFS